jgi:alanine racemase
VLPVDVVVSVMVWDFHRGLGVRGTFTHFATADEWTAGKFQLQANRFVDP